MPLKIRSLLVSVPLQAHGVHAISQVGWNRAEQTHTNVNSRNNNAQKNHLFFYCIFLFTSNAAILGSKEALL